MEPPPPPPVARVVFMIWLALLASSVACVFMADAASKPGSLGEVRDGLPMLPFLIIGGANVVASFLVRLFAINPFSDGRLSWHDPQNKSRFVAGHVACFALAESAAVFALVLRLGGGDPVACAGLFVSALMALVLHAPLAWRFQPRAA